MSETAYPEQDQTCDQACAWIGHQIKIVDQLIMKQIQRISISNGMEQTTVMHGWIIAYLYRHRDRDTYQKDLEAAFGISRSTVTSIVQLMEKKGYIRRVSVEKDARLKKLMLTDKALEMEEKNYHDIPDQIGNIVGKGIPKEDMETFERVLGRIRKNLEEREEE